MQEKVQEYLNKVDEKKKRLAEKEEQAKTEKEQRYKNDVLQQAGLFDREYCKDNEPTDDYPLYDSEKDAYYRSVPCQITAEEWEAVKAAYEEERALLDTQRTAKESSGKNGVAGALKAIAVIIYICALTAGIVVAATAGSIGVGIMFAAWFGGFIFGTMMLGFSEVIRLLDSINKK